MNYGGPTDPNAPQLAGLFADNRTGVLVRLHRVFDWNWVCNCRGNPLSSPSVTLAELATTPGEKIHVPNSGYTIGSLSPIGEERVDSGYEVLVLYAAEDRITLKYTRNDNVISGYTLHLEQVCVDPVLLALYNHWNSAGRGRLPALRAARPLAVRAAKPSVFLFATAERFWIPGLARTGGRGAKGKRKLSWRQVGVEVTEIGYQLRLVEGKNSSRVLPY